jgi:hypothetical protein
VSGRKNETILPNCMVLEEAKQFHLGHVESRVASAWALASSVVPVLVK